MFKIKIVPNKSYECAQLRKYVPTYVNNFSTEALLTI